MAANHAAVIGPNHAATAAVPLLCTARSATRIATLSGRTNGSREGATSLRPSTAESTEMAGVMIASP